MSSGGNLFYYHGDMLGSIANMTDAGGDSQWTYSYEPFGTLKTETEDETGAPENPIRFAGELEDETGLYHLRARQYDSAMGRFLSADPARSCAAQPAVSSYAYAADRPTALVDPSGMTVVPLDGGLKLRRLASSPQRYGNGCGPGGKWWIIPKEKIIPDSDFLFGSFDFSDACAEHDRCYGRQWGRIRLVCDDQFHRLARESCGDNDPWWNPRGWISNAKKEVCRKVADWYYDGVRRWGKQTFVDNQVKVCPYAIDVKGVAACITDATSRSD